MRREMKDMKNEDGRIHIQRSHKEIQRDYTNTDSRNTGLWICVNWPWLHSRFWSGEVTLGIVNNIARRFRAPEAVAGSRVT